MAILVHRIGTAAIRVLRPWDSEKIIRDRGLMDMTSAVSNDDRRVDEDLVGCSRIHPHRIDLTSWG
jgi:hypothetical protein